MSAISYIFIGMIVGLVFGPDSERENAANVDGWLSGYRFANSERDNEAT